MAHARTEFHVFVGRHIGWQEGCLFDARVQRAKTTSEGRHFDLHKLIKGQQIQSVIGFGRALYISIALPIYSNDGAVPAAKEPPARPD
jgi:hypothetical protein